MRIAVNVSVQQLERPGYFEEVRSILRQTGYPPSLLELELTESMVVRDFARTSRIFDDLREIGIQLALDDFGAGQSSFSHLHRLPFQRLKIDQSFIHGIGPSNSTLVRNMIQMAQSLHMSTTAEGVEFEQEAEVLRTLGCDHLQGYLFGHPMPPDEFAAFCLDPSGAQASRRGQHQTPLIFDRVAESLHIDA